MIKALALATTLSGLAWIAADIVWPKAGGLTDGLALLSGALMIVLIGKFYKKAQALPPEQRRLTAPAKAELMVPILIVILGAFVDAVR